MLLQVSLYYMDGEREIECVCGGGGGGLFPKFAPQGRLFDIHPSTGGTLVGEPKKIYSLW